MTITTKVLDLEQHLCITSANQVSAITKPLASAFGVTHFRYLKLYHDGSRILLSNYPECVRFMYGQGHYKQMWFDGEFPNCLSNGWHVWDALRAQSGHQDITPFEKEINHNLSLYHGMTFVSVGTEFYEIYTFDSDLSAINQVNTDLFLRFIFYFKEQANTLIMKADKERLFLPNKTKASAQADEVAINLNNIEVFLNNTRITRYYLSGKYSNVYLTEKEVRCVYWLLTGKSAEEIATIEGNTKKTVQCHFENIRSKLNCYKQTQIIPIILESGVLNACFDLNFSTTK